MATKKPTTNAVDHETQYQKLVKEMHVLVTDGAKQATESARQAILVANTFVNEGDKKKAMKLLDQMGKDLKRTEGNAKRRIDTITKKADTALQALMATRKQELALAKNAQEKAAADAKYNKAYQEIEKALMEKSHQLSKDYAAKSLELQKSAHESIKSFQKEVAANQTAQLDSILDGINTLEDEQKKAFDARKKRVKEEKKKTRAEEIDEELHDLDASWITRNIVRPITGSIKDSARRKIDKVKRVTGVSAIQNFVRNERVRKDRIDELKFEKNQMNTLGALRDRIVGEQARIQAVLSAGQSTSSGHTYESLMHHANQVMSNKAIDGTGITGAYDQITGRSAQERELNALEMLAKGVANTGKASAGFGIADLIALGGTAASALTAALAGFTPGKIFTAIRDWGEARFASIEKTVIGVWRGITESKAFRYIEEIYENVKAWIGGKWKSATQAISSGVSKVTGAVGEAVGKGVSAAGSAVKAVGSGISSAASSVGSAVSKGVGVAGDGIKAVGSAIGKGIEGVASVGKAVAGSPVGKFIGKNLGRLGNVAAIADVISGIYQEANGKTIDKMDVMDAILNPMNAGRFLGNKFNQLFESKMHQPLGAWIYDKLNKDPGYQDLKGTAGKGSIRGSATTVNSASVDTSPVQGPVSSPSGTAQGSGNKSGKPIASNNAVLAPSSIPDSAWQDPTSGAINMFAFGGT